VPPRAIEAPHAPSPDLQLCCGTLRSQAPSCLLFFRIVVLIIGKEGMLAQLEPEEQA